MNATINKRRLSGTIIVPGSKSHTIRAVIIATLAQGCSRIVNPLRSADGLAAAKACEKFGARITYNDGVWFLEGTGGNLTVPNDVIDVGNSGTTLYFISAVAATLEDWVVLTGDESIRRRPIKELLSALESLGCQAFTTRRVDAPPVIIKGRLKPGSVSFGGLFSQYISGLLIAAPLVQGDVTVSVRNPKERPYLKMTVNWMKKQGITLSYDEENLRWFRISGRQTYHPVDTVIPADWESAAFPLAAGVLCGEEVNLTGLDFTYSQGDQRILEILRQMGATIQTDETRGYLSVKGAQHLQGVTVDCSDIPDAVPILAVVGAFANGPTTLRGIEMVRTKETDRVWVMQSELTKMGVRVETTADKMTIHGGIPRGAQLHSHGDHRVAMSLMVAGLAASGTTVVEGVNCVEVSFPDFIGVMNSLGANIRQDQ